MTSYVVCVGLATKDTILAVPRHPSDDELVMATDVAVAGGGPAATAAVALARLRIPVFFVGAVGSDETGEFISDGLRREGVDVSELVVAAGCRSAQSAIFVGSDTRAIAAFRGDGPQLTLCDSARDLCRGAAWVHVDQTGYGAVAPLREEVRLSVDGGNPISELDLDGVSLFGPTETQLRALYPGLPVAQAVAAALRAGAELVVVTRGKHGSLAARRGGDVLEAPGIAVEAVSTLGAGDVFHGALLAQLVRDVPLPDALTFANTCAALSCRALDGRSAIPSFEEVAA